MKNINKKNLNIFYSTMSTFEKIKNIIFFIKMNKNKLDSMKVEEKYEFKKNKFILIKD